MIDIHQHLFDGLDGSPADAARLDQMLLRAENEGLRYVIATLLYQPAESPFRLNRYLTLIWEANLACTRLGLALEVLPGAELLLPKADVGDMEVRVAPTLAGSDRLLVSFPPHVGFRRLDRAVARLNRLGYVPVIARPERCPSLMALGGAGARWLKARRKVRFQADAGLIATALDEPRQAGLRMLLRDLVIDYVASDAQDAQHASCRMREARGRLAARYGDELSDWWTGAGETPRAFLAR